MMGYIILCYVVFPFIILGLQLKYRDFPTPDQHDYHELMGFLLGAWVFSPLIVPLATVVGVPMYIIHFMMHKAPAYIDAYFKKEEK